jgi:hypothetical protein
MSRLKTPHSRFVGHRSSRLSKNMQTGMIMYPLHYVPDLDVPDLACEDLLFTSLDAHSAWAQKAMNSPRTVDINN